MPPASGEPEFELCGWHVQPSLNRLRRGEVTVRLEPKMMDVLVALAARPGEVLSKDEIVDAVWPNLFVTEAVITRAIAGLRRALEDDARTPRFIETIAKRGYRLVARPTAVRVASAVDGQVPMARGAAAHPPFAVGQWVCGERFYGRDGLLAELLGGPRNGIWLLGSRAIGKTSTLKQLALLAAADQSRRYLPLFWDLQGCESSADFDAGFREALAETGDALGAAGLAREEIDAADFVTSLGRLRRALRAQGRALLLLVDEAEELLALRAQAPASLRKLRSALQAQEGVRTVLASGSRLWRLAEADDDTSPFLHGFAPPVYLGPLDEGAARGLVRQSRMGGGGLAADEALVGEVVRRCAGHPYLLQLLCTHAWRLGDLEAATAAVRADPGLHRLLAVDFGLLSGAEQALLAHLAATSPTRPHDPGALPGTTTEVASALLHLERLGVVRGTNGRVELASEIVAGWLRDHRAPLAPAGAGAGGD